MEFLESTYFGDYFVNRHHYPELEIQEIPTVWVQKLGIRYEIPNPLFRHGKFIFVESVPELWGSLMACQEENFLLGSFSHKEKQVITEFAHIMDEAGVTDKMILTYITQNGNITNRQVELSTIESVRMYCEVALGGSTKLAKALASELKRMVLVEICYVQSLLHCAHNGAIG